MKKLFVFAFVSLSMLSSCSSDDSVNVSEEKLTKKWYYKSYQVNGQIYPFEHMSCGKDYMELLANGTYIEYYVNTCNPIDDGISSGNWVLEGNTLAIAIGDGFEGGKITKLTDTELHVTATKDFDDDGDTEKVKYTFTNN